jgi:hypothetical protein
VDKRYQIFVSSTFADLKEERQAVMQALLSLEHFPAGMEAFPASDDDAWTLIQGVIDDSDYYVLVIGGRYGSTNEAGLSYTQMEFDYAAQSDKPILAFLHHAPDDIPAGKTDKNDALRERLAAFRRTVEDGHHVKYWKNPDDLKAQVIQSVSAETRRTPQEGWVRASRASDPIVVEKLRQEIENLRGKLNAARDTAPPGAERYAGGEDVFGVKVQFTISPALARKPQYDTIKLTWNDIFYVVGPMLLEEANERQIHSRLSNEIWVHKKEKYPTRPDNFKVEDDSFDTIKVQLLALGLIKRSERKHTATNMNTYWSLTPFGETTMMKLRAITKIK